MEIEYQYHFGLPRTVVWKYIKNDKVLRNALPGCKSFAQISTGVYLAEIQMNMGPIQDLFKLEIQLDGEKEPSSFRLKMKGNGNLGQMNGSAILMLKENQGGTQLNCKAKGQVSGAIGLAGKRVLDSGAEKGLENFFTQLEKEIKRRIYQLKKRRT